jgi:hypothetical protein
MLPSWTKSKIAASSSGTAPSSSNGATSQDAQRGVDDADGYVDDGSVAEPLRHLGVSVDQPGVRDDDDRARVAAQRR